jgi:hypothetical protein
METKKVNYKLLSDLVSFTDYEQMYINRIEELDVHNSFGVVENEMAKAGIFIYSNDLEINMNKPSIVYHFPDENFCGFTYLLFFEL